MILSSFAAAAWPLAARAQQRLPVIGFLGVWASPKPVEHSLGAFREGLAAAGFVEGQNVTIEYRWGNFQFDRLKTLATELVRHPVSVIVAAGFGVPALAAKAVTSNGSRSSSHMGAIQSETAFWAA